MKKSYFNSGGNDTELIAVLNAISHVSARMARNMTILAQQRHQRKENVAMREMSDMAMTIEELRSAAAAIRTLLQKYGASKLSAVDPKHYVVMSLNFMSQTNRLWMEIYQIVKENCATEYKGETPMDDAMERLLRARKGN